ncbi:hypothetical protein DSL72_008119 [Monilinia vaccinii-corymbosi]|uniref:Uncharacterized protein n=1 Tax=Monilinia vaccinii-corymbosi TaxID=61207 RepID=A0A8A3PJI6_9HELO|nr:hypothetical protein DSL72_008119 [Monilinia vaccinii-corymbosi]
MSFATVTGVALVTGEPHLSPPHPKLTPPTLSRLGRYFDAGARAQSRSLERARRGYSEGFTYWSACTQEEVTNAAVFLCSPSASYVNGAGLLIDAGMTVTAHV